MTHPPITVNEDTSLNQVVHLMERHKIKRLPVVRNSKVVGMVSRANLIRALASIHRASPKTSRNDQAIRKRIITEIENRIGLTELILSYWYAMASLISVERSLIHHRETV